MDGLEILTCWAYACVIVIALMVAVGLMYVVQRVIDGVLWLLQFIFDYWSR